MWPSKAESGQINVRYSHQPPSWNKTLATSYEKCTAFCVVREAVVRAVSECKYFGGCKGEQGDVNEYIAKGLQVATSDPFVGLKQSMSEGVQLHSGEKLVQRACIVSAFLALRTLQPNPTQ